MSRRASIIVAVATFVVALLSSAVAFGEYRGTDVWSNITPGGGGGGLADKYPLSHYQLDVHVDNGLTGTSAIPAQLSQYFASQLFFLGAMLMRLTILVFDWAFNTDMLTGENGLLSQLSSVVGSNYRDVVLPFIVPAVIFLGAWVGYKAVKREQADVMSAVVRTMVFFGVSFVIAFHPSETIGRLYRMVDQASAALVSHGSGAQTVSDSLFETFVYRPWAVLQFSGLKVCTGAKTDDDDFPLAATDSNPPRVCHDVLRKDSDGHGDYAHRFVRYPYGSDERDAEYNALREGVAPRTEQFSDVKIDKTDAPAVDLMQEDGALQRLIYSGLLFVGTLAGVALLGLISVAALVVQVGIALMFVISPFVIIASILPMAHGVAHKYLKVGGHLLVGKLVYSLMLMVTLSTSAALMTAGGESGYLLAFIAQSALFVLVVWKRKLIIEKVTSSKTAHHYHESESKVAGFASEAAAASMLVLSDGTSAVAEGWFGRSGAEGAEQEKSAGAQPSSVDATSPPASAGRSYSQPAASPVQASGADDLPPYVGELSRSAQTSSTSAPDDSIPAEDQTREEPVLRSFKQDLEAARSAPEEEDVVVEDASGDDVGRSSKRLNGLVVASPGFIAPSTFSRDLEIVRETMSQDDDGDEDVMECVLEREVPSNQTQRRPQRDPEELER